MPPPTGARRRTAVRLLTIGALIAAATLVFQPALFFQTASASSDGAAERAGQGGDHAAHAADPDNIAEALLEEEARVHDIDVARIEVSEEPFQKRGVHVVPVSAPPSIPNIKAPAATTWRQRRLRQRLRQPPTPATEDPLPQSLLSPPPTTSPPLPPPPQKVPPINILRGTKNPPIDVTAVRGGASSTLA